MKSREFMVRKEYRSATVIAAVGILLVPVFLVVNRMALGLPPIPNEDFVGLTLPFLVLMPFLVALTFWAYWIRLRIDDRGIGLRVLAGWTRWNWEDFECGRVERGPFPREYIRVPRRRGEVSLCLDWLDDEAVEVCEAEIEKHLRPGPIAIPDELDLRYPKFLPSKTEVRMDASGIRLTRRGKKDFFSWNDVRRVLVEASTMKHRDFLRLEVDLPGRSMILRVHLKVKTPLYVGPEPKVVRAFLESYIEDERWVVAPRDGYPATVAGLELEKRRIALEKRQLSVVMWTVGAVMVVCIALALWDSWDESSWALRLGLPLLMLFFLAITLIPVWKYAGRIYAKREKELAEAECQLNDKQEIINYE